MDGKNNGKSYEQMDDLGGPSLYLETPILLRYNFAFRLSRAGVFAAPRLENIPNPTAAGPCKQDTTEH